MAEYFQIVTGWVGKGETEFEEQISRLIKEGWLLHGSPIYGERFVREIKENRDGAVFIRKSVYTEANQALWSPYLRSSTPK